MFNVLWRLFVSFESRVACGVLRRAYFVNCVLIDDHRNGIGEARINITSANTSNEAVYAFNGSTPILLQQCIEHNYDVIGFVHIKVKQYSIHMLYCNGSVLQFV